MAQWMRLYRLARDGRTVEAPGAWRLRLSVGYGRRRYVSADLRITLGSGHFMAAGGLRHGGYIEISWYRPVVETNGPTRLPARQCRSDGGTGSGGSGSRLARNN